MPEPGWVRDPSGRYHQRFFDGTKWTDHVADEYGRRGVDPVEAIQRSGPEISAGPPLTGNVPAVVPAPTGRVGAAMPPSYSTSLPRSPSTSTGPGGLTVPALVAGAGALVATVSLVFLPWLEDVRAVQAGFGTVAGSFGVWESSYFDAGWVVSIIVATVVAYALATAATTRAVRPWLAGAAGLCVVWAIVGTFMLRSAAGEGGLAAPSLGYGFFIGVVGLLAVAVAPLLPDRAWGAG